MRTVQAVAWKEIQIYFGGPTAYIVGLIFLGLTGFFFAQDLESAFPEASLGSFFQWAPLLLILMAPTLTMRLLAEEQKLGTIELLLTSPVRDWEVVVGKYLASLVFLLATLSLTLYYTLLLAVFANPDPGPIYSGYLGLVLLAAVGLSVGMLTTTLTSNQIVAAVVAMGILLALYFVGVASGVAGGVGSTVINEIGLDGHFEDFAKGIIDTKHIVYFVSLTIFFLFLTVRALESRRWR
ncbi:MAG: ABC transporter permease subunit [Chloroflexi bacterium]|nr:ABC transporter permease subunit [Chloroflexota bacterium]